jgi:hypothetical protein
MAGVTNGIQAGALGSSLDDEVHRSSTQPADTRVAVTVHRTEHRTSLVNQVISPAVDGVDGARGLVGAVGDGDAPAVPSCRRQNLMS